MTSLLYMLATVLGGTPWGIDARLVHVEVDVRMGLPQTHLVGLGDTAVRESRERVRSAIRNSDIELPHRAVVIHLAPADLRKQGSHLDLPIALGLLAAHEELAPDCVRGRLFCGELGLDGQLRPVRGGLALASLAAAKGLSELILPRENASEAAALEGVTVIGVETLAQALAQRRGAPLRHAADHRRRGRRADLADVRGHTPAKRALEIAAAGGPDLLRRVPPAPARSPPRPGGGLLPDPAGGRARRCLP